MVLGVAGVLYLVEKFGSKQECSQPPQIEYPVNKDLFLSPQIYVLCLYTETGIKTPACPVTKGLYLGKLPDIDLTTLLYIETMYDVILIENIDAALVQQRLCVVAATNKFTWTTEVLWRKRMALPLSK